MGNLFKEARYDLPAGLVVFFVVIPMCLGIPLASGAPLLSGLVAGVVGGILCGFLSRSPLSITGPAAGLSAVALYSISELGSFSFFLLAVVVAGMIQIVLGLLKAGSIARFFPVSVIKGMLTGIGLILIFKQIPHALGYDVDLQGTEEFQQLDNENTLSEILQALQSVTPGAVLISVFSLGVLVFCSGQYWLSRKWTKLLPGPLMAVLVSIVVNELLLKWLPGLGLNSGHLVAIPHIQEWTALPGQLSIPDFDISIAGKFAAVAFTIAIVASIETLLNIEAVDKLDPYRRITPLNRELIAQGTTNIVSGLLGGLPVTAVIVRSSLNINAGARTRLSTITQGFILAVAVIALPGMLERIPLACLAVILIVTGYKLAPVSLWKTMFGKGIDQFIPFAVTAFVIFFSNLLVGILLGLVVALFFVLKSNFHMSVLKVNRDNNYLVKFTKDVSFLNKARLYQILEQVPRGAHVFIDGTRAHFIDNDIVETIEDFQKSAPIKNITVEIVKKTYAVHPFFKTESEIIV